MRRQRKKIEDTLGAFLSLRTKNVKCKTENLTKIFCFFPFAHFLIFYFWHFSDALYAQVHGKMEARALLTEAVSVGVFRRCCNSSDLGWRDQQTMAVLYHRRNNQQDCLMGFWIVFRIADICTGIGTLFQSDKQFFPWNALLVSSLSSKLNFFCCEQSRWCQPPGSFPSLALGSVIFRLSHI